MVVHDEAVLVLVDLQERLAEPMSRRQEVVDAGVFLVRAADALGVPVIVTRQYPRGIGETVDELKAVLLGVEEVDKLTFSCTGEPVFQERMEALGRRQVIIAGMETHVCVMQTALALQGSGYQVFVLADASSSRYEVDHALALDRMRASGVVVTSTESVVYEMIGCAGTPEFKALLPLVKERKRG